MTATPVNAATATMQVRANANEVLSVRIHSFRNLLSQRQLVLWQYNVACVGSDGIPSRPYQSVNPPLTAGILAARADNSLILSSVGRSIPRCAAHGIFKTKQSKSSWIVAASSFIRVDHPTRNACSMDHDKTTIIVAS